MIKDYYVILAIRREASDDEIKRAYRSLAFRYHPDKNTSLEAKSIIQDINEAYDVLGNKNKRQMYNVKYDYRIYQQTVQATRPPKVKATQPVFKKKHSKKSYPKTDYKQYAHQGKIISFFILIFTACLCFDYLISTFYRNSVVEEMHVVMHRSRRSIDGYTLSITSSKVDFSARTSSVNIATGDTLDVDITPLFGIVKKILKSSTQQYIVEIINVYNPFVFCILLSFACCAAALTLKSHERSFTFSIANCFVFLLLLYLSTQF